MIKTIELNIPNTAGVETFKLEFSNLTYDIFYETFNQDLHVEFLRCVQVNGLITRSFSHRMIYAMAKTRDENFATFRTFLNSLTDDISSFNGKGSWGEEFADFTLELFSELLSRNDQAQEELTKEVIADAITKN